MSERFARIVWKRVLPFAAALASGVVLASLRGPARLTVYDSPAGGGATRQVAAAPSEATPAAPAELIPSPLPTAWRGSPSLHVLSPMLVDEALAMERLGRYESAQITSPPGVMYVAAEPRPYRQGVLQVNFLFGTDGRVSDVTPVEKRVRCGACLEGERGRHSERVLRIDASHPRLREFLAAAEAALKRIEFVPAQAAGRPYPTHGFAECIFRLD